jgi:hypothetical protein
MSSPGFVGWRLLAANPGNFVTQPRQLLRVPSKIETGQKWNFYALCAQKIVFRGAWV